MIQLRQGFYNSNTSITSWTRYSHICCWIFRAFYFSPHTHYLSCFGRRFTIRQEHILNCFYEMMRQTWFLHDIRSIDRVTNSCTRFFLVLLWGPVTFYLSIMSRLEAYQRTNSESFMCQSMLLFTLYRCAPTCVILCCLLNITIISTRLICEGSDYICLLISLLSFYLKVSCHSSYDMYLNVWVKLKNDVLTSGLCVGIPLDRWQQCGGFHWKNIYCW